MKKITALSLVAITSVLRLSALDSSPPSLALHLGPGMQIPLGGSADYFTIGGLVDIVGEFAFTEDPRIFASAGIEYLLGPLVSGPSISALAGDAGGGVYIDITPRLGLKADASIGYNYSFLNGTGGYTGTGVTSGGSLHYTGGLGVWYLVSPSLNVGLRIGYGSCLGLTSGLSVALGTSYYFTGREARLQRIEQGLPGRPDYLRAARTPNPEEGIRIDEIAFQDVFPVFHAYYSDHPLGTVILHNQERRPITDITLTVYLKEYMDAPKECRAPKELKAGETANVELFGLFNKDKVLGITEGTKTPAEITLEYRLKGQWYRDSRQATVRLYDRNAMSWDDDRKAAAFVTAKDPSVLRFAKNAAGAVDAEGSWTLNANLQTAMGIHEALTLYGIRYVVDPKTPYAELSQKKASIDFLQFPRQTLEYLAGDCDDLSILYAALLESAGVGTAFITVPGHIFIAFNLGIAPDEAKKALEATDLIFVGDTSWVPLEVTERSGGFTQAWDTAAREWRDYSAKGQARFYDMHEAWDIYEPVGLPGTQAELAFPTQGRIVSAFQKEMARFIQKVLDPQVKKLEAEIKKSGTTPALQNRLGVLYARYGLADKALAEFQKALAKQEYLPALVNLGNLYFLRGTWAKALEFYERAAKKSQDNASVQLGIARTQYQLGNTAMAKKALDAVKNLDPGLAAKYAYLESGDTESARAGAAENHGEVPWQD